MNLDTPPSAPALDAWLFLGEPMATWVPAIAMITVLIWGAWLITAALAAPACAAEGRTRLAQALSEKTVTSGATVLETTSFSRTAGAIGAVALASFFVGLGLWLLFVLNDLTAAAIGGRELSKLDRLPQLWFYVLSGVALFMPYAVNRLSAIYGVPTSDAPARDEAPAADDGARAPEPARASGPTAINRAG